jgi:hypothetical protein
MAQTGFTPIQLYSTSTAAAAPVAGNLTNSTLGSELAINITDGKLFYKDNANAVQVIGWKTVPTTAGGTGLTTYTAGDLSYYATGTTFTKLAIGTAGQILTSTGTAPQWTTLSGVAVTTFSAGTTGFTPNSATSGAVTLAGTLVVSNGGTGLTSLTVGRIPYGNNTSAFQSSANLNFNGASLGVGVAAQTWASAYNAIQLGATGAFSAATTAAYFSNNWYLTSSSVSTYLVTGNAGIAGWEGGAFVWYNAPSGTAGTTITFTERMRLFESGGVSIDGVSDPGTGNLRLGTGNLIIGTSGKGIDFSATAGTGTSELLNDYEEGTWTPTITALAGSITTVTASGTYTKVGRQVTAAAVITITTNGTGAGAVYATLPFGTPATSYAGFGREAGVLFATMNVVTLVSDNRMQITSYNNAYPGGSGSTIVATAVYFV